MADAAEQEEAEFNRFLEKGLYPSPAMITEGVDELMEKRFGDNPDDVVVSIYMMMEIARRRALWEQGVRSLTK